MMVKRSKQITCDICGGLTHVTRVSGGCEEVARMRVCDECGHKVYTLETQIDKEQWLEIYNYYRLEYKHKNKKK